MTDRTAKNAATLFTVIPLCLPARIKLDLFPDLLFIRFVCHKPKVPRILGHERGGICEI